MGTRGSCADQVCTVCRVITREGWIPFWATVPWLITLQVSSGETCRDSEWLCTLLWMAGQASLKPLGQPFCKPLYSGVI
jgi:hypothetical protein